MRVELAQRDGEVVLAIADDGSGIDEDAVRARASRSCARSCATSCAERLDLHSNGGLRAEVVFPA